MGKRYKPKTTEDKFFTAYIVKGNRQVIERNIIASKRFRIEDNTYIVKADCILRKNIGGELRGVAYYREGNPNPYNFTSINKGLTSSELDKAYSEDFHNILVDMKSDRKTLFILVFVLANLGLSIAFIISRIIVEVFL